MSSLPCGDLQAHPTQQRSPLSHTPRRPPPLGAFLCPSCHSTPPPTLPPPHPPGTNVTAGVIYNNGSTPALNILRGLGNGSFAIFPTAQPHITQVGDGLKYWG